jgi:competence protein ComEA
MRRVSAVVSALLALALWSGVANAATQSKADAGQATPAMVDLNNATAAELETLPGVGAKTAQRIIEHRQKTPFKKIEELMNVKGIGEKSFLKLKSRITVTQKPEAPRAPSAVQRAR